MRHRLHRVRAAHSGTAGGPAGPSSGLRHPFFHPPVPRGTPPPDPMPLRPLQPNGPRLAIAWGLAVRATHCTPLFPRGMDSDAQGIFFPLLRGLLVRARHARGERQRDPPRYCATGYRDGGRQPPRGRCGVHRGQISMHVVVVESPAKAKTIRGYLGPGYEVIATRGHVRDLPKRDGAVDPAHGFAAVYVTQPGAGPALGAIRAALKDADGLILATDPDREGEAIAWQVLTWRPWPGRRRRPCPGRARTGCARARAGGCRIWDTSSARCARRFGGGSGPSRRHAASRRTARTGWPPAIVAVHCRRCRSGNSLALLSALCSCITPFVE